MTHSVYASKYKAYKFYEFFSEFCKLQVVKNIIHSVQIFLIIKKRNFIAQNKSVEKN